MNQLNALAKSKIETELDFLAALERGEVVTQITLSKRIAVSVGLINALLKRAIHKGYVKVNAAPCKRYAYYLTPQGFTEKSRLVAEYLEASLSFFRQARKEFRDIFAQARQRGIHRIALFGGGELAEIALMTAREAGIDVKMIFDPSANIDRLHGISIVRSFEELPPVDGVVITDSSAPQQTFDATRELFPLEQVLVPPLLHVADASLNSKVPRARPKEPQ